MSMDIQGTCIQVMPLESGVSKGGKEWRKLSFVIEYGDQYKKKACLTLWGDKCNNKPAVGDNLTCSVNIESREYNGKFYTEVQVWKISGFTGNMGPKAGSAASSDEVFDTPSGSSRGSQITDDDSLPF